MLKEKVLCTFNIIIWTIAKGNLWNLTFCWGLLEGGGLNGLEWRCLVIHNGGPPVTRDDNFRSVIWWVFTATLVMWFNTRFSWSVSVCKEINIWKLNLYWNLAPIPINTNNWIYLVVLINKCTWWYLLTSSFWDRHCLTALSIGAKRVICLSRYAEWRPGLLSWSLPPGSPSNNLANYKS
jgi:hypothetical protein